MFRVFGVKVNGAVRNCNECGGEDTVELIVNVQGLWSRCRRCGFTEWEWSWRDNIEYLKYLSENFNISLEKLLQVLEEPHFQ